MADTPTLELQIRDNSDKAIEGLKRLASSLNDLKSTVSGGLGLAKVANSIEKFSQRFDKAFGPETVAKLNNVADALDKISKAGQTKFAAMTGISRLSKSINGAKPELDSFAGSASAVSSETGKLIGATATVKTTFKELAAKIKESIQGVRGQSKSIGDLKSSVSKLISPLDKLINRFNRLLMTRILRTVIKEIGKAFKEGITNVRAYSKAISGSFNTAMKSAEDILLKMKNSLGAALAPALEALVPVLRNVVSWFIELVNYVNQFMALLSGKSTWTRAIEVSAEEFEKTKKTVVKADKEVKNLLADFDELNIIQQEPSGSGGSGGKIDTTDYTTMFEEVGQFDSKIKEIVTWLKDNMDEVKRIAGLIGTALLGWKFSTAFAGTLGTLGALVAAGAIIAITWNMTSLFNGKYLETKNIGWLIADVLTTALGALATRSLITSVLGTGYGYVAAGIVLAVSATATVVSVLKSVDVSALSKESVTSLIVAGVKYGAAGMFIARALNAFGVTSFSTGEMVMIGGGATLATFGAALALKATADSIASEETEETLAAKAVGSLSLGLGGTLIAKALTDWNFGQALTFGLGVFGITFGATLGIQAVVDAVTGKPDEETIAKTAVSSLGLGLGGGLLAKSLKSWKFGKSFTFGLGVMGITLGAMIGIKAFIDQVKGEPKEKVLIEKAVASLALGFGAGKLAGALNEWKFGRSFTFGLGAMGVTLGAMFGVQAMIDAVNGEPSEKVFIEAAVASLGLGFGAGSLAKALNEWKFGKSFSFGLGVVGITFGTTFGVKAMIDAVNGEPNEQVFIETAIASLGLGFGAGKLAGALGEWKFGRSFTFGLGVIGITLGAMLGVKAYIDEEKGETTEKVFAEKAVSSLALGLGTGKLAGALNEWKFGKSFTFGLGVMGITLGAEVGVAGIVKAVKNGEVTNDTYKHAALSSLGIGLGSALLAIALGAPAGVVGVVALGAAVATVAAVVAIATLLTSKKEDLQWGSIRLTDEEIQQYVRETLFPNVNIAAKITLANSTVSASEAEKTSLREQVEALIPTIEKIKTGINVADSLAEMKVQLFGDDGTGGLMADIQSYAKEQQTVISTGVSLVPIINEAGENVSESFLKSGITGWQGVSDYMSNLGTQLGQLFQRSLDGELDDTEKALLEKLTTILNNVTMAITSSQITSEAFANLSFKLSDLDKGSFGKAVEYYNEYVDDLTESYRELYKQELASFAGLQSFYKKAAEAAFAEGTEEGNAKGEEYKALAEYYAGEYAKLYDRLNPSVEKAVNDASAEGKTLVIEAIGKLFEGSILSTSEIMAATKTVTGRWSNTTTDPKALEELMYDMISTKLGIDKEYLKSASGLGLKISDFISKDVLYGVLNEINNAHGFETASSMAKYFGVDEWIEQMIPKELAEYSPQLDLMNTMLYIITEIEKGRQTGRERNAKEAEEAAAKAAEEVTSTIDKDDPMYEFALGLLEEMNGIYIDLKTGASEKITDAELEAVQLAISIGSLIGQGNQVAEAALDLLEIGNELRLGKQDSDEKTGDAINQAVAEYVNANNEWLKTNQELSQLASQDVTTLEGALEKWLATLELGQRSQQLTPYTTRQSAENVALFTGLIEDLEDGVLDSTSLTDMAEAYRLLSIYYDGASEGLRTLIDTLYVESGEKDRAEIKELDNKFSVLVNELDIKRAEMEELDREIEAYRTLYGGLSPELGNKKATLQADIDALVSQSNDLQARLHELTTGEYVWYDEEDEITITFTPSIDLDTEPIEPVDTSEFLKGLDETSKEVKGYADSIIYNLSRIGGQLNGSGFVPKRGLKFYAEGGFVSTGDMFIAREAGPELVGRIGNRTAVANNDQIVSGVASGVAAGQAEQNYLLRQQNEYLRAILAKESTVRVEPSAGWGRFNRQSEQMYARNAGG